MLPAFLTTVLFSLSAVFARRTSQLLGGTRANFFRLCLATSLLAIWAHGFGGGLGGGALSVFFVSGCVGFGIGDLALYQALPRIGSRLTILLVHCLAAPLAAVVEWLWLGTQLTANQLVAGGLILAGVCLALAPGETVHLPRRQLLGGVLYGVIAAVGQGMGAVLSRKAYGMIQAQGEALDGGTAAYQRILGGIVVGSVPMLVIWARGSEGKAKGRRAARLGSRLGLGLGLGKREREKVEARAGSSWQAAWPWVLANSLAGPVIGVACFQWALATTPSGVVLPIVATTPLVVIPFTYHMEGDRPGLRAWVGGVLAVSGVILMTLLGGQVVVK